MDLTQALALVEEALKDGLRLGDEGFTVERVGHRSLSVDLDSGPTIYVDVNVVGG